MSDQKKLIRPDIPSIKVKEKISIEEKFQNEILRPIIELQHELIISCFQHYLTLKKIKFNEFSEKQKRDIIEKSLNRDSQLKKDFQSLIIGLFTLEEYNNYLSLNSQINKRINSIIQSRISSVYFTNK